MISLKVSQKHKNKNEKVRGFFPALLGGHSVSLLYTTSNKKLILQCKHNQKP